MPEATPLGWAVEARARIAAGPTSLVTILAAEGSAPRGAGTRMVVTAATTAGTIGGGQLELRAIEQARAILGHAPGAWRVQDYPLGPLLGQCCGGRVRLLVEHLDPADCGWLALARAGESVSHRFAPERIIRTLEEQPAPSFASARGDKPEAGAVIVERLAPPGRPLFLFGAGHVGQAIAARLPGLPLALHWFDTRTEAADRPGVALIAPEQIEGCVGGAGPVAAILILTHDHGLDYRIAVAALWGQAAFVGLIGSATKRARFLSRLANDGVSEAARARLVCPIGLPGIVGKEPEVIAIAALAQLLALPRPAT